MFADYGSIHLRSAVQDIINPVAAIKSVVAQTQRTIAQAPPIVRTLLKPVTTINNVIMRPLSQATAQISRTGTTVLNPLVLASKLGQAVGGGVKGALLTGGMSLLSKPKETASTSQGAAQDVYQDANGKVITKEQYDALMAAQSQTPQDVYKDANGNIITKTEYDRQMALYSQQQINANQSQEPTYQDANGNVISKAEYDRQMALYNSSVYTNPSGSNNDSSYVNPGATSAQSNSGVPNISTVPLVSSSIPQDYSTAASSIDTGGSDINSQPVIYQDQYGRRTTRDGYPVDAQGNILKINQMPEYKNTVVSEINRLKSTS